jgi:hypothetical protein
MLKTITLLIPIVLALCACITTQPVAAPTHASGLTEVHFKPFDTLLIKPHTNFSQYRKIRIEPLSVSYSQQRRTDNLHRPQSAFEFDEKELALFNRQFLHAVSTQWQKTLGWELTEQAGDDVIVVRATISDLYLYASIKNNEILPHQAIVNTSSKMLIQLELIDSTTGEILLQSKGRKTTGQLGNSVDTLQRISSVSYWNDAYQAFRQWAALLGSQMTR